MGAAVNLAHRLQAQARGGEVVISQDVYRLINGEVLVTREFQTRLKGFHEPVTLYAVRGMNASE